MSRIKQQFEQLKQQNRSALIPYVTATDPNPALTLPLMHAMVEAGADLIELGVPFSDPMADGPVIQKASERALLHQTSLEDVLEIVASFREKDDKTPVILMGYLNPIEVMGYERFAQKAAASGVDGVLIVDFPPEESSQYLDILTNHQIDSIFLLSPTTTKQRIRYICEQASGFVYYVSVKGVTGSAALDTSQVASRLETIRQITTLPVGVGFGIKDAKTAATIGHSADAVIVGSALVNIIAECEQNISDQNKLNEQVMNKISMLLKEIRTALDNTGQSK